VILDTSAIVAILQDEAESELFKETISANLPVRLSAGTFVELGVVALRARSPALDRLIDDFMVRTEVIIEPVTERQARIAREAYRDYGKGSGHPAGLNFGDCFAYALARDLGEPLLYKGIDFAETDVRSALK
jgi:ribonuclease VapC